MRLVETIVLDRRGDRGTAYINSPAVKQCFGYIHTWYDDMRVKICNSTRRERAAREQFLLCFIIEGFDSTAEDVAHRV